MDDVTKEAVRQLREVAATWRKYVGNDHIASTMATIVETACAREESREEPAAIGSEFIGTLTIPDPRTDFRERVILALVGKGDEAFNVASDDQVPGAAAMYGKVLVLIADAVCDAAYPQPKKETA